MNTLDLIERAALAGVAISFADGRLALTGPRGALASWRSMLFEQRSDVLAELARRKRPSHVEAVELRALCRAVYPTSDEAQQGYAFGLLDIDRALVAYRALASEQQQQREAG